MEELNEKDFRAITVLLEADRDSYQSNISISNIFNIKDKNKIKELIQNGVKDNLKQVKERFDLFKGSLGKELDKEKEFKAFDNYYNLTKQNTLNIKELVENATTKANQGKMISDQMISGYHKVNENIDNTLDLIKGISVSSKEQQAGIEQINNAVSELDQQTQRNATVASQTNDIAVQTLDISKTIVESVEEKEFRKDVA